MPTPPEALTQVSDIVVRLVGGEPGAVEPSATLKELGLDSLTTVELADELGDRFDLYLSDDTVNSLKTVQDAVDAVVHHDGSTEPAERRLVAVPLASTTTASEAVESAAPATLVQRVSTHPHRGAALRALGLVAFVGAALGIILGMGGAALIAATGIKDANLPPLTITTTPEPTQTTEPPEEPKPEDTATPDTPQPTLKAAKPQVAPGERFALTGSIPALGAGATLQVQVKDPDTDWDDFPVTTVTKDDGTFETVIYTSRTGERKFRLTHKESNTSSPEVTVQIG